MNKIHVLQPHIANQIAAGEVVERPMSIVKELVENAVDANASRITVTIKNGGIDYIQVTDDGVGIFPEDCAVAFKRHATSKITSADDLTHIETLGFRGEALASIAAVARVELRSKTRDSDVGTMLRVEGGEETTPKSIACPNGTSIEVRDIFYNVPARLKFLKTARTEGSYIGDYVARMILAHPHIAWEYINNDKTVYQSDGNGDLLSAICVVYGLDVRPHLREIFFDDGYLRLSGYVGTAELSRPNRMQQTFLLNGRYIKSIAMSGALQRAFDTRLMHGRFPFAVIALQVSSREVDVNVHPNKLEVRFADESRVIRAVQAACSRALGGDFSQQPPDSRETLSAERHIPLSTLTPDFQPFDRKYEDQKIDLRAPKERHSFSLREPSAPRQSISRFSITAAPKGIPLDPRPQFRAESSQQETMLPMKPDFRVAGQLFHTYLLIERADTLFIIDQHAAHERILYEEFIARPKEQIAQLLLMPLIVHLDAQQYDTFIGNQLLLEELGFQFGATDTHMPEILAVPYTIPAAQASSFFCDALALLQNNGDAVLSAELKRERIIQSACKHAIKAGQALSQREISQLFEAFDTGGIPMTCPHGRPVMVTVQSRELQKLFKRIV